MNIFELNLLDYLDIGLYIFVVVLMCIFIIKSSKSKSYLFIFILTNIAVISLYIKELYLALIIVLLVLISTFTFYLVGHETKVNELMKSFIKKNKVVGVSGDELDEFYEQINDTIIDLSKTKTGAILTFEKGEDLTDYIEKGKRINCKVNSDILRTIFFVGTPLHDGAVIIRGNNIEAASVFYSPTTKAMAGKFGARHRAALGFSESHSSLTVVVSEETGRISFALNGELLPATHENFKKRFIDLLKK